MERNGVKQERQTGRVAVDLAVALMDNQNDKLTDEVDEMFNNLKKPVRVSVEWN